MTTTVGLVTKTVEGEDTVYRIGVHDPGGQFNHVLVAWVIFLLINAMLIFVFAHGFRRPPAGVEAAASAVVPLVFWLLGFASALLETWWYRVTSSGSEVLSIRGKSLTYWAAAFGHTHEWRHRLDTMFKATWSSPDGGKVYFPRVIVGEGGMTVARNVESDEGGEWLASELTSAIKKARGWA